MDSKQQFNNEVRSNRSNVQFFNYKKFGHKRADCWFRNGSTSNIVNMATEKEKNNDALNLFVAECKPNSSSHAVWLVDVVTPTICLE